MRLALAGLLGMAVILAGVVAAEALLPVPPAVEPGPAAPARAAPAAPEPDAANEPDGADDHTDEWVQAILARPLFTRDRKPLPEASKATAERQADTPLPRLTGIMVSPGKREAIFSGAEGTKPVIVNEGDAVAGFKVDAIAPGSVRLVGPDGPRTLAPAFDPNPPKVQVDPNAGQAPVAGQGVPGQPQFPQPGFQQPGFPQFQQPGQPLVPGFPGLPRPPGLQPVIPGRPRVGDAASAAQGIFASLPTPAALAGAAPPAPPHRDRV